MISRPWPTDEERDAERRRAEAVLRAIGLAWLAFEIYLAVFVLRWLLT